MLPPALHRLLPGLLERFPTSLPPGINSRGTGGRKTYPRHAVEARELQLEKKSKLLKREMPRRYVVPERNRTFLSQGEKMRRKAHATSFSSLAEVLSSLGTACPRCATPQTQMASQLLGFFSCVLLGFFTPKAYFPFGKRFLGPDRPKVDVEPLFGLLETSLPFCTTQNH